MLMSADTYNFFWQEISKAGQCQSGAKRGDPIWMELERILNKLTRHLFMSDNLEFTYDIALDDDKLHYEWSKCPTPTG